MAKLSIDVGNDVVRDRLASQLVSVFLRWLRDLGKDRADLIEVITVRSELISGWLAIYFKIVIIDPVTVYDGLIIRDRPKFEASFCLRYDPDQNSFADPFNAARLSAEYYGALRDRTKMLRNNIDELNKLAKKAG